MAHSLRRCLIGAASTASLLLAPQSAVAQHTETDVPTLPLVTPPMAVGDLLSLVPRSMAFRRKTVFDAPPMVPLAGRRFDITLPVRPAGPNVAGCTGEAFWRYYPDSQRLDVWLTGGGSQLGDDFRPFGGDIDQGYQTDTVILQCSATPTGSYRASNAFGATTTVFKTEMRSVEIGQRHMDTPFLEARLDLAPDEARRLSQFLAVRIEGHFEEWSPGQSLVCGTHANTPTMLRDDKHGSTCLFRGEFDRVTLIDRSSGRIYAEHKPVPPASGLLTPDQLALLSSKQRTKLDALCQYVKELWHRRNCATDYFSRRDLGTLDR